jgi:hypothetical protein
METRYDPDGNPYEFPIGETLIHVTLEHQRVILTTEEKIITLGCEGDCCNSVFFSDLEVASDLPATIHEWEDGQWKTIESEHEYSDIHETMFIKIKTDKGYIDFTLHNDHNGYYGGMYFISRTKPNICIECEHKGLIGCFDGAAGIVGLGCPECGAMFDLQMMLEKVPTHKRRTDVKGYKP